MGLFNYPNKSAICRFSQKLLFYPHSRLISIPCHSLFNHTNEIHEEQILRLRSSCDSVFPLFCSYDLNSTYYQQQRDVRHLHLPSFRMRNNFHTPVKDHVTLCFNQVRDIQCTVCALVQHNYIYWQNIKYFLHKVHLH